MVVKTSRELYSLLETNTFRLLQGSISDSKEDDIGKDICILMFKYMMVSLYDEMDKEPIKMMNGTTYDCGGYNRFKQDKRHNKVWDFFRTSTLKTIKSNLEEDYLLMYLQRMEDLPGLHPAVMLQHFDFLILKEITTFFYSNDPDDNVKMLPILEKKLLSYINTAVLVYDAKIIKKTFDETIEDITKPIPFMDLVKKIFKPNIRAYKKTQRLCQQFLK